MNMGEKIDQLFDLRARKKELQTKLKDLNKEIQSLEYEIIENMEDTGLDKVSTDSGTVSMKVELYPSVDDQEAFIEWCYENGRPDMIQKRVSSRAFREYFEETGEFPEGVKAYDRKKLNIRRK